MPIFEYKCADCGEISEVITFSAKDAPTCGHCKSGNVEKLLSAPSSSPSSGRMPGPGDTACCGSSPGQASGCAGPGSCCGSG